MFMSKTVGLSLGITFATFVYAAESPNLGTLASAAEIAAYDLTVMPPSADTSTRLIRPLPDQAMPEI